MKRIIFCWIPVVAWMGIIFYFSHIPSLNSGLGEWDFWLRKAAHVFEYAVLVALIIQAMRQTFLSLAMMKLIWISIAIAMMYAISDEIHQSFVVGRYGSIKDVLIDGFGIVAYSMFYVYKHRKMMS